MSSPLCATFEYTSAPPRRSSTRAGPSWKIQDCYFCSHGNDLQGSYFDDADKVALTRRSHTFRPDHKPSPRQDILVRSSTASNAVADLGLRHDVLPVLLLVFLLVKAHPVDVNPHHARQTHGMGNPSEHARMTRRGLCQQ